MTLAGFITVVLLFAAFFGIPYLLMPKDSWKEAKWRGQDPWQPHD